MKIIKLTFLKAQQHLSCHEKYLKVLEKHYNEVPYEEFFKNFAFLMKKIMLQENKSPPPFIERLLEFCVKFVIAVSNKTTDINDSTDESTNLFLTEIINETLKYHKLVYEQARYNSCRFITLLLKHLGYDTHLDNDVCDLIQDAMLERIHDHKHTIRLQAVTSLVRLQEPRNPECPVVKAYLTLIYDTHPLIRKEIVKVIAPNSVTISKIKERVRDSDYTVRKAAFARCGDIGPKLFRIVDRQFILFSGFNEPNKFVHQFFIDYVLVKWLSAYNGDYLKFLSALKLDADENDIKNSEEICKKVMNAFFKTQPVEQLVNALPIDKDKLIPINQLTSEVTTYWLLLTNFLRDEEDGDEFLESTLPELMHFCNYIENVINCYSEKKMEEWEYLDYQFILCNLFKMVERYDMADEVGRRTLLKNIMTLIPKCKFQFKLLCLMVEIASNVSTDFDVFTNEMCQIISDIREPLVEEEIPPERLQEREFKLAEIKVKINRLEGDKEEALFKEDFKTADEIQNKLIELRSQLDNLKIVQPEPLEKVKQNDKETICRCLDVFASVLLVSKIKNLTPGIRTCLDEFVLELLTNEHPEVNWRVLKCIKLCCLLDKTIAFENAKILAIPIASYRTIPYYNKMALRESLASISDLIRLYGPELFRSDEESSVASSSRRRLYRNEDMDDFNPMDSNAMTLENVIDIVMDILDDDDEDVRCTALEVIFKLVLNGFTVNPNLISRLVLKWYNPSTDLKLQQKLGILLESYISNVSTGREVLEKAVCPIITTLANAPKTSPLADIDIDNVLQFMTQLTNGFAGVVHLHNSLAFSLCQQISNKPHDNYVPHMTKMLNYLEISPTDSTSLKELINMSELILKDVIDKAPKRNILKFNENLRSMLLANEQVDENKENGRNVQNLNALTETNNSLESNNHSKDLNLNQTNNESSLQVTSPKRSNRIVANSPGGLDENVTSTTSTDIIEESQSSISEKRTGKKSKRIVTSPEVQNKKSKLDKTTSSDSSLDKNQVDSKLGRPRRQRNNVIEQFSSSSEVSPARRKIPLNLNHGRRGKETGTSVSSNASSDKSQVRSNARGRPSNHNTSISSNASSDETTRDHRGRPSSISSNTRTRGRSSKQDTSISSNPSTDETTNRTRGRPSKERNSSISSNAPSNKNYRTRGRSSKQDTSISSNASMDEITNRTRGRPPKQKKNVISNAPSKKSDDRNRGRPSISSNVSTDETTKPTRSGSSKQNTSVSSNASTDEITSRGRPPKQKNNVISNAPANKSEDRANNRNRGRPSISSNVSTDETTKPTRSRSSKQNTSISSNASTTRSTRGRPSKENNPISSGEATDRIHSHPSKQNNTLISSNAPSDKSDVSSVSNRDRPANRNNTSISSKASSDKSILRSNSSNRNHGVPKRLKVILNKNAVPNRNTLETTSSYRALQKNTVKKVATVHSTQKTNLPQGTKNKMQRSVVGKKNNSTVDQESVKDGNAQLERSFNTPNRTTEFSPVRKSSRVPKRNSRFRSESPLLRTPTTDADTPSTLLSPSRTSVRKIKRRKILDM